MMRRDRQMRYWWAGIGILCLLSSCSLNYETVIRKLKRRPYLFEERIIRCAERAFPHWDEKTRLRFLNELFPLTDAEALDALYEVASQYDLLLKWDESALSMPCAQRKKLRNALGNYISQTCWRYTPETAPDGTYALRLKDHRNGDECVFHTKIKKLPEHAQMTVFRFNSDLEFRLGTGGSDPVAPAKTLFSVRRDAETNLWYETIGWREIRRTRAVTTCEIVRASPVCSAIVQGRKIYTRYRLRDSAREFKLGELRPENLLAVRVESIQ